MKKYLNKFLFFVLKSLIYTKKFFVFLISFFSDLFIGIDETYKRTLGFKLYKTIFAFKKKINQIFLFSKKQSKLEILGSRTSLQLIVLFFAFLIILPQTKIFKDNELQAVGRNSLLFKIMGPGQQAFTLEEVSMGLTGIETKSAQESWKTGVISLNKSGEQTESLENITGLSLGGSVIKKPIIISNLNFEDYSSGSENNVSKDTGRKEILIYEVLPGDVLGKIAEKFGISINTILWANNLTINSYIKPGDKLAILPVSGITHKVGSGDTVSKIARTYGAKSENIINFNNLENNGASIKIGDILVIPDGQKVQASTYRPSSYNSVAAAPASANVPAGTGYLWPTSATIITQYFGLLHGGLDIAGPIGTPLYASKSGKVLVAKCGWNYGYGCYVHLDHGNGVQTIYAHASALYVSAGDYVSQGQTVAAMGSTGNSTGPHIHFEIRVNGVRQNPLAYIRK
ncbi:MAG: peptidoglycan DD-metalloendopeptidase family protein [Patescibacteria group bacterium]